VKGNIDRPEKVTFRLLDQKDDFYDYIEENDLHNSDVLRHFVKQGIAHENGRSLIEEKSLRSEIVKIHREMRTICINLNQIAHNLNKNETLLEKNLEKNHSTLLANQSELEKLLHEILRTI